MPISFVNIYVNYYVQQVLERAGDLMSGSLVSAFHTVSNCVAQEAAGEHDAIDHGFELNRKNLSVPLFKRGYTVSNIISNEQEKNRWTRRQNP